MASVEWFFFLLAREMLVVALSERGKRPLFEKSGAKTFVNAGPEALSVTTPQAQH
jgi:hypothetical protein